MSQNWLHMKDELAGSGVDWTPVLEVGGVAHAAVTADGRYTVGQDNWVDVSGIVSIAAPYAGGAADDWAIDLPFPVLDSAESSTPSLIRKGGDFGFVFANTTTTGDRIVFYMVESGPRKKVSTTNLTNAGFTDPWESSDGIRFHIRYQAEI